MAEIKNGFSTFSHFVEEHPEVKLGCLVDTNILFSASYPLDSFNEAAENIFEMLANFKIPVYSNHNIRSEFLELHRRVLIPECLIDFLDDMDSDLDTKIRTKLASLKTQFRAAQKSNKTFKLADKNIKEYRNLLSSYKNGNKDGWELFCENYLHGKIEPVWQEVVEQLGLNFIGLRADEENPVLHEPFQWEGATDLIGKFGIGSTDAMILELFFRSKFLVLLTADRDMAYCIEKIARPGRFVFLPDELV